MHDLLLSLYGNFVTAAEANPKLCTTLANDQSESVSGESESTNIIRRGYIYIV